MANGREKAEWMRVQIIVQRLAACWMKDGYKPEHCNPYYVRPKRTFEDNAKAMGSFLDELDVVYGGR